MTTIEKISKLRQKMQEKGINAFIVFSADPHMSEYLPEEWQERTWLSGFTGSAGFLVVTNEKAAMDRWKIFRSGSTRAGKHRNRTDERRYRGHSELHRLDNLSNA